MKNKIDLNSYLNKYAQQGSDLPMQQSRRYKGTNDSFEKMRYTSPQEPDIFSNTPSSLGGFSNSQNECIEQLQEVRRTLQNEERDLTFFLENYSKRVHENMLIEHNRIRETVLDLLDRLFNESEQKIGQIIAREQGRQPIEFTNIRKRIQQINQRLDELDSSLRGQNYRKAIADVVTSDFQGEIKNMQQSIESAKKIILDNATKVVINQRAFNQLKDDILALVTTDDKRISNQLASGLNSLVNSNVKKGSKSRLGLFDQPNPPKEIQTLGGFFNFGS